MKDGPKISLPEAYLLIAFAIIADCINAIPIINLLVTLVTLPAYWLYFKMKHVPSGFAVGGNLLELLPILSILPAVTFGVVATIVFDRMLAEAAKNPAGGKLASFIEKFRT